MEILVLLLGIAIDRFTKIWALNRLSKGPDIVILKDLLGFSYLENRGAAFGIFQNKLIFLVIITSIVMLGIIYFIIKYKPKSNLLRFSLMLIVSGAIGNLIDRLYYNFVVDFIVIHYKDVYYFPTFNVADMLVVVGTILLAIYIIKED
ncbi:signal peptidase II [Clostridium oceanicum]|uniref:Lipoprotein signal peptidase n=1 Tax=Clostridium oceanicum TaxID=1543 RepID=A0ABN1JP02_9CLOT